MAMRSPPPLLHLLAAAGLGLLGGALGGVTFAGGRTPPPAGAEPDLTAVVDELRALRRDLQTRATPSRAPAAGAPGTPPAERQLVESGHAAADVTELAAVVARLVQVVETLATRADALGAQQAAGRGVLEQFARRATRDVPALAVVARALQTDRDATQQNWMFTPATEILRRFGPPSRIENGNGGLQWVYEFQTQDDSWWLAFTVADGVVVRVD